MKRFSMAVILGLTLMLLALAPQLRADGYDHFNYEHGNTLAATSSSPYDVDAHSNAWRDDDDDRRGDGNWGGWGMHVSHSASGSDADSGYSGSVSMDVSTPEPSSLLLLLSGLAAAAVGFALKKVAT
jgi:hypothetical protein